jgi:transcriptional regulator with AAA-type ATPase domain
MQAPLADRFVPLGHTWIDLASGLPVRLRIAAAPGDRAAQMQWNDRSAELARMRHPLLNGLIDFGFADRDRTFEAYGAGGPARVSGSAGSLMLTHAVRFLESRNVALTPALAPFVVRDVRHGARASPGRPLGVLLQPPPALDILAEALDDASPGGVVGVTVAGPEGCGLRTLRALASRTARVAGYVPLSGKVALRLPQLRAHLLDRHVCVLMDDDPPGGERDALAAFLAGLAIRSARRHVLIRFVRSGARLPGAVEVQPMSLSALTAMVFVDRDCGPRLEEIEKAALQSSGYPGAFLKQLRAASFVDHVARIGFVHESSPAYAFDPSRRHAAPPIRGIGRALRDAAERGARLAARGRHASAVRLLTRASRVLEGRTERQLAAACAEALAWIERDRGRSERALAGFERAHALAGDGAPGVSAAIGIGVVWTDLHRFTEAEAALRGACTAAGLLTQPELSGRAVRALARCLHSQSKHDEAAAVLAPLLQAPATTAAGVEAWALAARTRVSCRDLRAAMAAASAAAKGAERLGDPRATTTAARAMALVQFALGDADRALEWVVGGLRAAARAHLPIAKLRLHALSIRVAPGSTPARLASHLRTALEHRPLPALVRADIEASLVESSRSRLGAPSLRDDRTLTELQRFLEAAQAAQDDNAALEELCRTLAEELHAATVQIVSGPGEPRTLARAGRPWQGDSKVVERVLAGGTATPAGMPSDPRQGAEPIRYGAETVAVLCCRWTPGVSIDAGRASMLLRAGALAAAASVRGLLDRVPALLPEGVCGELVGASPAAAALRDAIARAARAPFPVLVEGESGSGKELVARAIHRLSSRRDRRLCTLNCAALSDDLVEAELFGHARGAFTGAVGERAGLFEEADGGTIFLDEVGELSPRAQAKLLRVLQDGEVRRVGENMPRRVDARVVAATNRRLDEEVAAQRFRADLRFRLDVVRIAVPPLRERATDIPLLAAQFWADATSRVGSSATMASETLSALARYDWPGNVRELQNAIASLAVHAPRRGRVVPSMLPSHIARSATPAGATFEAARHDFERRYVRAALAQAGGQRIRAARALGVSRQGLAKMLRRLRIDADRLT